MLCAIIYVPAGVTGLILNKYEIVYVVSLELLGEFAIVSPLIYRKLFTVV